MQSKQRSDLDEDGQLIVEEKIVKINGEMTIRKYVKSRFLGKVPCHKNLGWSR